MCTHRATPLTRVLANQIIEASICKAEALETRIAVTVSDADGQPISQQRMDRAPPRLLRRARNRATTAARLKESSANIGTPGRPGAVLQRQLATNDDPLFAGGLPLTVAEETIGAIGVGGADVTESETVAQAGVDAFQEQAQPTLPDTEPIPRGMEVRENPLTEHK